ncbi:MAG: tRNA (guanosine(46)-N7)-methyltransferase TrmB [Granulosicoccus sp.]|nr:tRNA (guanosine(46)-N7)-methyltransferase TrmB [Granulosicoccus sp.]
MPDKLTTERQNLIETDQESRLTRRSIRSFVIRNGRVTAAQQDALERLMPSYGLDFSDQIINPDLAFGRPAPLWLDIGFGNGDTLLHVAKQRPETNVLGIEVHSAGIGHALMGIESNQLSNIRVIQHDAMEVLGDMMPDGSVERILLFFPDPWPKKRHHKRRIVQKDFIDAVCRVLSPGGLLHCATDWADYANWMLELLDTDHRLKNLAGQGKTSERPQWRPETRFEKRGQRLGHEVSDLIFQRMP